MKEKKSVAIKRWAKEHAVEIGVWGAAAVAGIGGYILGITTGNSIGYIQGQSDYFESLCEHADENGIVKMDLSACLDKIKIK